MSVGQWLTSAAIGALVSSLLLLFDHWRERTARKREMLFRSALEISKASAERLARTSEKFVPAAELAVLPRAYKMVKEVYDTGTLSESNMAFINSLLRRTDGEDKSE